MRVRSKNPEKLNLDASKTENWWEEPVVQYGFNFPSVGVNLDRLMGTNIVQMTDPSFMLELRDRVWNDFDTNLTKRINERRRIEDGRITQLILKGAYNSYNRPQKFIPVHSAVLALDLGCRKNLKTKNSKSLSPILKINERTNAAIDARRLHLTSIRKRNVNYAIRQMKLEGVEPNIQHDELTAIETKIRQIKNEILEIKSKTKKVKIR